MDGLAFCLLATWWDGQIDAGRRTKGQAGFDWDLSRFSAACIKEHVTL